MTIDELLAALRRILKDSEDAKAARDLGACDELVESDRPATACVAAASLVREPALPPD